MAGEADINEGNLDDIFAELGNTAVNIIRTLQGRSALSTDTSGNLINPSISTQQLLIIGFLILIVVLLLFRK